MWRYSLLDDFIPDVSQQLFCSCSRVPANRIRNRSNKYHALSYQQGYQIHRHNNVAKTLAKVVLHHDKDSIQSVCTYNDRH